MKLRILACSLLAVLASCASSSNLSLDERVAEAAEHEFDMEMTGVEKVDAILTASSIVLEVYKTNLVAERARNSVAAVSSFDGRVNNELTAAGIEPDEATDDQKKEFAKKVWDAMTPEEQQALETQGQAWSAVSDTIVKSLKRHVKGQVNEFMERRKLRRRKQEDGESFDDFLVSLRELAKTCNFCTQECSNKAITDQIIEGSSNDKIVEELLMKDDLTLETAINVAKPHDRILSPGRGRTGDGRLVGSRVESRLITVERLAWPVSVPA